MLFRQLCPESPLNAVRQSHIINITNTTSATPTAPSQRARHADSPTTVFASPINALDPSVSVGQLPDAKTEALDNIGATALRETANDHNTHVGEKIRKAKQLNSLAHTGLTRTSSLPTPLLKSWLEDGLGRLSLST